jgi:hypothetical protein
VSEFQDPLAAGIASANQGAGEQRVEDLLSLLNPQLALEPGVVALVHSRCGAFRAKPLAETTN